MNIALFGGTFDPIHNGHLRAARAATRKFRLDRVLFVPSGNPPHKHRGQLTPFSHRFAMVSLACAAEPRFVPSLLEAPDGRPQFSVDTLRRVKRALGEDDHLFFLTGLDAFLDIPQWKQPNRLLDTADFIVVSRPGFEWHEIIHVIPRHMLKGQSRHGKGTTLPLRHTRIHLLTGVNAPVSSSALRRSIGEGRAVTGLIPRLVEEYIMKEEIYKTNEEPR
ncbi:MAG: nicotinate-nucleotide adenylyltransferase [Terriglobia bacterium]